MLVLPAGVNKVSRAVALEILAPREGGDGSAFSKEGQSGKKTLIGAIQRLHAEDIGSISCQPRKRSRRCGHCCFSAPGIITVAGLLILVGIARDGFGGGGSRP